MKKDLLNFITKIPFWKGSVEVEILKGGITNQNFLAQLIRNKNIIKGNYNTNFLDSFTINNDESANKLSIAASIFLHQKRKQKPK